MKTLLKFCLSFILITGCNNNGSSVQQEDSTNIVANPDSMPVVNPPNTDTTPVLQTPPTNDSNVVKPDSGAIQK